MSRQGGGSTLAGLSARRQQLQAARKALGMGTERGAPQAPTRANPNPPPPPQQPGRESQPPAQEDMRGQVEEFLNTQRSQQRGEVPVPRGPAVRQEEARPTQPLATKIGQLGATGRSPETQFFRLAGREATPRELAIFNARLSLEQQLNRPPTSGELRLFMARPSSFGPLFSAAVDGTPLEAS